MGIVTSMLIPLVAVAFNLVVYIFGAIGRGIPRGMLWNDIRSAVVRAVQYAAVIAMLFVAGRFDGGLAAWATGAAWIIGITELAAGLSGAGLGAFKPPAVNPPAQTATSPENTANTPPAS